jgi:hypothetical protein
MAAVSRSSRSVLARIAFGILTLADLCSLRADAQQPVVPSPSAHVLIPFLANATKPADLEFEGAECEVDKTGNTMECEFQQVFLTTTAVAPQTCVITTNRYGRTFHKQAGARWVSSEAPVGACGFVDITTLQNDGGVRWTMETRKTITRRDGGAQCHGVDEQRETLSWQNLRRALPCTFVQPGGLSR